MTPFIGASVLAGLAMVAVLVVRREDQLTRDNERVTYGMQFPPDLSLDQATAFVRSLTGLRPRRWWLLGHDAVALEVIGRGTDESIEHRLRLPRHQTERVLAQLRALVPGVRVQLLDKTELPAMDAAIELAATSYSRSLRTDQAETFASAVLAMVGRLNPGSREVVVLQVVALPVGPPTHLPTRRPASMPIGPSWLRGLMQALLGSGPADKETLAQRRTKISEPGFAVVARVGAVSAARGRSRHLAGRLASTLRQVDAPGVTLVTRRLPRRLVRTRLVRAATPITHAPVHVNARELATLLAWPVGNPTVPGLAIAGGREFPPTRELRSTGALVIGQASFPGMERRVAISLADAMMHLIVSGPTGSGKSTFLLNLIQQIIFADYGLILIDPNGDLTQDAINILPPERLADLIFINPADHRAVGLNPLACALDDAELVADQILQLVRDRSESWGVVIDETLKNTLVLLAATPGMALTEVPAVLVDVTFRGRLLANLNPVFRPTIGEFFARFESWSDGQRAQAVAAVLNKTSKWLDRRPSRAMLGQAEPTWTMPEVLNGNKLLVVSLPSGLLGSEAADLIGGLVAAQAWNFAQGRAAVGRDQRRATFMIIDELPRFVRGGSDLADVLARARGHGLSLVGAVQHIGQVRPELRAALMSEARNKIVFQPAADDASLFARQLGVRPEDLLTLPARTALASLVVGGRVVAPVSVRTFPPPEPSGHGDAARTASREAYGRDRAEVERAIAERRRGGGEAGPRRTRRLP